MVYRFAEFELEPERRALRSAADGRAITLTAKMFDTLLYLIEHRGRLIEKRELLEAVWPNVVVEEANLPQITRATDCLAWQKLPPVECLAYEPEGQASAHRHTCR